MLFSPLHFIMLALMEGSLLSLKVNPRRLSTVVVGVLLIASVMDEQASLCKFRYCRNFLCFTQVILLV